MVNKAVLDARSKFLRHLIVEGLDGGERGHVGSSLSLVEILRVLYDDVLNYRPLDPAWEQRDRCILSKGHGCLALYAILVDKGFFPREILKTFCREGSILGGHPEYGKVPGVEFSTGALGHGLSVGVGMALAARIKARSNRVFVITGDGEINEGSIWEAALSAGKHGLGNLTVLVDYNKLQSYGPTSYVQPLDPLPDKWESFGFSAQEVDGHDVDALREVLARTPFDAAKPSAIICHTVKGKGISFAENQPDWHHKSRLAGEVIQSMYDELEPN